MNIGMNMLNQSIERKLCHKGIDSFKAHLKSDDIYADPAGEVKKGFDVSNCEFKRPLSEEKTKKIQLMTYKLGGQIMKEFVAQVPVVYSHLTDNRSVDRKAKGTKKCVIKKGNQIRRRQRVFGKYKTILGLQQ